MKRVLIASLALFWPALSGAPAFGQATPEQTVAYLDKDGDGKVGLQEYLKFQVTRIAQFDADGDGVLKLSEFTQSLQGEGRKNAKRSFDNFNNEDNRSGLTQREFLGYHAFVFKNYVDLNKDDVATLEEWRKLSEGMAK